MKAPNSFSAPRRERAFAPIADDHRHLLSPDAVDFLAELHANCSGALDQCIAARRAQQARYNRGERPDFLAETRAIREGEWTVAPPPPDLVDRRVEITGPPERAMVVNALNSAAKVFMADFEDALAPTWAQVIGGQQNLFDAIRRQIDFTNEAGKRYRLANDPATLIVRPRGLHLPEKHFTLNGQPVAAALFDAGLYLFHNAHELLVRGSGPYLYLPKLENHREARVWNEALTAIEERLELPVGTVRVTVLIETLPAVFEMDEILYELRDRVCGLNCGRWDYIFSFIKTFREDSGCVLPERAQITMERHFLRNYSRLLIRTCHRRSAHAMGGMAPDIPVRDDSDANAAAMAGVRADKEREALDGHDGTWVAHPGMVPVAMEVFDRLVPGVHQIERDRTDHEVTAEDLLQVPDGTITEAGLRDNVSVAVRYIGAWLAGRGCVPIRGKMEDAATAEIARAQLWQWIHHDTGRLEDGRPVTVDLVREALEDECLALRRELGEAEYVHGHWEAANVRVDELVRERDLADFLTTTAYERL